MKSLISLLCLALLAVPPDPPAPVVPTSADLPILTYNGVPIHVTSYEVVYRWATQQAGDPQLVKVLTPEIKGSAKSLTIRGWVDLSEVKLEPGEFTPRLRYRTDADDERLIGDRLNVTGMQFILHGGGVNISGRRAAKPDPTPVQTYSRRRQADAGADVNPLIVDVVYFPIYWGS